VRWGPKVLIGFTGLVSITAFIIFLKGVGWLGTDFLMYWLVWCAGAVLAKYFAEGTLRAPSKWVILTGFVSLVIAVAAQTRGALSADVELLYGYFYLVLLWYCLNTEHIWNKYMPKLLAKGLVILGTCSYSLYLIHKPIFRLLGTLWKGYFGGKPVNFFIPIAFAVLIVFIAWGFYNLIEAPSHKWAKKIANRMKKRLNEAPATVKV
jgi:peptidoglycan/LPS O-acetylase OafA/YrhL